jgi:hypothetical protein
VYEDQLSPQMRSHGFNNRPTVPVLPNLSLLPANHTYGVYNYKIGDHSYNVVNPSGSANFPPHNKSPENGSGENYSAFKKRYNGSPCSAVASSTPMPSPSQLNALPSVARSTPEPIRLQPTRSMFLSQPTPTLPRPVVSLDVDSENEISDEKENDASNDDGIDLFPGMNLCFIECLYFRVTFRLQLPRLQRVPTEIRW